MLVDYLIDIAYNTIPSVRQQLDRIPKNNLQRDDLQAAMNASLKEEDFANVIDSDTVLYKLSWREEYSLTTIQGERSIYAGFLEMEF